MLKYIETKYAITQILNSYVHTTADITEDLAGIKLYIVIGNLALWA